MTGPDERHEVAERNGSRISDGDVRRLYSLLCGEIIRFSRSVTIEAAWSQQREIRIEMDNRTVFQNAVSLSFLSQILQAANMDMPGGQFQQQTQEFSVRLKGELSGIEAMKELEIPTRFGNKKLGNIPNLYEPLFSVIIDTGNGWKGGHTRLAQLKKWRATD